MQVQTILLFLIGFIVRLATSVTDDIAAVDVDGTCVVEHDIMTMDESVVKVIQIGQGGKTLTPASIIVIENFLPENIVKFTFENITNNNHEWKTVIPFHQKDLEALLQSSVEGENNDHVGNRLLENLVNHEGGFPGIRTDLTELYENVLKEKLESLDIEKMLGLSKPLQRRWSPVDSFFGNVCYHPSSLGISQRAPHTDVGVIDRKSIVVAVVHYLSPKFEGLGGTSFYKESSSDGSRFLLQDCKILKNHAKDLGLKPGSTKYLDVASCHCKPSSNMYCHNYQWYNKKFPNAEYTNDSNEHYELLLHVPYKFNTAVLYSAQQLHSAYIDDETLEHLSCDAKNGRVTSNVFLI